MRWTLKEIHVALVAKWNGPRDGKISLIGESVASCILRRQALCGEINRRFCELPACFRRADNFLLPLYESNLSGRDIEYLFDKQDSYTKVNTFLTVKNALFLTNRGIDVCLMWFISRVKLKSWREKRWIWLKYYLLGQRS